MWAKNHLKKKKSFFFFNLIVFITDTNAHMLTHDTCAIKSSVTAAAETTATIDYRIFRLNVIHCCIPNKIEQKINK